MPKDDFALMLTPFPLSTNTLTFETASFCSSGIYCFTSSILMPYKGRTSFAVSIVPPSILPKSGCPFSLISEIFSFAIEILEEYSPLSRITGGIRPFSITGAYSLTITDETSSISLKVTVSITSSSFSKICSGKGRSGTPLSADKSFIKSL